MADALVLGASTSVCGFKSHLPHHVGTSFARSDFLWEMRCPSLRRFACCRPFAGSGLARYGRSSSLGPLPSAFERAVSGLRRFAVTERDGPT